MSRHCTTVLATLLVAVGCAWCAEAQATGTLRVVVRLVGEGESVPGAESVIWLPQVPAPSPPEVPEPALEITQEDRQFHPRVAVVPLGSTVRFPNNDRIFHNVFSLSAAKTFDLGLYRNRQAKSVTFDQPGLVQIYCNIHPQMVAYLMVVDAARYGLTDADGVLELSGVAAARQPVMGWSDRGGTFEREVVVPAGGDTTLEVELDVSDWRQPTHLNKHGKPYAPPDDDDFRY